MTSSWCQWLHSSVFIVTFEHTFSDVSIFDFEPVNVCWVFICARYKRAPLEILEQCDKLSQVKASYCTSLTSEIYLRLFQNLW